MWGLMANTDIPKNTYIFDYIVKFNIYYFILIIFLIIKHFIILIINCIYFILKWIKGRSYYKRRGWY